jgi:hypothetical protein
VHCASVNCSVNCGNLLSSYQEPLHIVGKIWGSHGDEREDGCFVGCDAV